MMWTKYAVELNLRVGRGIRSQPAQSQWRERPLLKAVHALLKKFPSMEPYTFPLVPQSAAISVSLNFNALALVRPLGQKCKWVLVVQHKKATEVLDWVIQWMVVANLRVQVYRTTQRSGMSPDFLFWGAGFREGTIDQDRGQEKRQVCMRKVMSLV